jgi:uncharacterized protein (TIGR01244 family)
MNPFRVLRIFSVVLIALVTAACGSEGAQVAQVGEVAVAQRVDGYSGVNNLFHDGSFFFAGQPDAASLQRLAEEGVRTVINLRRPSELEGLAFDEPAVVEEAGMSYWNIPVTPATLSADHVDQLAEILAQVEGPVMLHCGSSNRVGGLWATYLVRHRGMDVEEAIDIGKAAGLRSQGMIDAVRRVVAVP